MSVRHVSNASPKDCGSLHGRNVSCTVRSTCSSGPGFSASPGSGTWSISGYGLQPLVCSIFGYGETLSTNCLCRSHWVWPGMSVWYVVLVLVIRTQWGAFLASSGKHAHSSSHGRSWTTGNVNANSSLTPIVLAQGCWDGRIVTSSRLASKEKE